MDVLIILGISIALQFYAAFVALRLIKASGRHIAWIAFAAAIALMALRRAITFVSLITSGAGIPGDLAAEIVAVACSFLMVIGLEGLRSFFADMNNVRAELLQARKSMADNEQRLRGLFEQAPEAYFLLDYNGKLVEVNKNAEELLGKRKDGLIGKGLLELGMLSQAEWDRMASTLSRIRGGWVSPPGEFLLAMSDGSIKRMQASMHAVDIFGAGMVFVIAHDITKARENEIALRNREKLLSGIIDSSHCGIVVLQALRNDKGELFDYEFVLANPMAEKICGFSCTAIIGRRAKDVESEFREEAILSRCTEVLETDESQEFKHFCRFGDKGKWRQFMVSKFDDGVVITFTEIALRKHSIASMPEADEA